MHALVAGIIGSILLSENGYLYLGAGDLIDYAQVVVLAQVTVETYGEANATILSQTPERTTIVFEKPAGSLGFRSGTVGRLSSCSAIDRLEEEPGGPPCYIVDIGATVYSAYEHNLQFQDCSVTGVPWVPGEPIPATWGVVKKLLR